MPGAITLEIDQARLKEVREVLAGIKNGANRAITGAINETLSFGLTHINRRVREELNLPRKSVAEVIRKRSANFRDLEGWIVIKRKPIPLYDFGARWTKNMRGASVKVRKDGVRKTLGHTFIATMKSGHKGVFEREGEGGTRDVRTHNRVGRLKIYERHGPTVLSLFKTLPELVDETLSTLGDRLNIRLASKVGYLLETGKVPVGSST